MRVAAWIFLVPFPAAALHLDARYSRAADALIAFGSSLAIAPPVGRPKQR
jgi:hypothetical protein